MIKGNLKIALLIEQTSTHTRGIARGISRYARIHGPWIFAMQEYKVGGQLVASPLDSVKNFNGDGIISYTNNKKHIEEILNSKLPVVNTTSSISPELKLPSIFSDDYEVGKLAANYFIEKGFKTFGFMGFDDDSWQWSATRKKGFTETIRAAGFDCFPGGIIHLKGKRRSFGHEKKHLINWIQSLRKPISIMAIDDTYGRILSEICMELGINVPEEVAIIGVNNNELICEFSNPSLSSVVLAKERIGFQAAKILDEMIQGKTPPEKPVLIPPVRVVTRRSSDVLAIEDRYVANAINFIHKHSGKLIGVDDILREVPLSRRSLEIRFRKTIGSSPHEEIQKAHIERAKVFLVETSLSMPQVAAASGFSDAKQLSTVFSKHLKITPSKYRQQLTY